MRLIAFITEGTQIMKMLERIGATRGPRTYLRRADRRCGRTAMRKPLMVLRLNRTGQLTGIGQHNRPPITRSISISVGDKHNKRFCVAAAWLCVRYMPRSEYHAPEHQTWVVNLAGRGWGPNRACLVD